MDKRKRLVIQGIATLLQNANFKGFFTGKIYEGPVKNVCVPGLNCYSCPGAVGSCPIGSLQNSLSGFRFKFPYYVLGLLFFFGALLGRLICGFLCPFGFLQDLLYLIPLPKKIKNRLRSFKGDKILRYLKYGILAVMVIILPVCIKLTPFFCKYLCPSGTIAGLLLSVGDPNLTSNWGGLFFWKLGILVFIILISILIARPFCKYLCPLGAIYGLMNKISLLQMKVDADKCTGCGACQKACDMNVDITKTPASAECIRCGKCISTCPGKAIGYCTVFQSKNNQ